jgi:O-antigen/teichoic acid export membrane protein
MISPRGSVDHATRGLPRILPGFGSAMIASSLRTIGASLAAAAIAFASSVIFARLLGPEGRGGLAAAMLVITSASMFSQFGLGQSLVFQVRSRKSDQRLLFFISVVAIAACAALLASQGRLLSPLVSSVPLYLLELGAAVYSIMAFCHYGSQLQHSLLLYNAIRVFQPLMVVIGVLAAVSLVEISPTIVVTIHVVSAAISALAGVYFLTKWLGPPSGAAESRLFDDARTYVSRGLSYHGLSLTGFVSQNIDKLYLMTASNALSLGLYVTAYATSRAVGYFYEAIATSLYSRFAGGDKNEVYRAVTISIRLTFIPMLAGSLLASLVSGPAMAFLFGREFAAAGPIFAILVVDGVVGSASWVLAQQFNAIGRPGLVLARQVAAVLPVLAGLYLVSEENAARDLAILVLSGSVLRLAISLFMFRMIGLPVPRLWPNLADIALLRSILGYRPGRGPR